MIPIASYYFLFKAALFPIGSYDSYSFLWPPIGAGVIHVLLTAHKIQSKCPAAARVGINPTPTLDICCIAALCRSRGWVCPSPTNSG